jgi:hypothetical protein
MSHLSMILSGLMTLAMVIFIAPGIFALNRGHILRNIALWLAIFLGLTLFYQNFGPDSAHPLFNMPDSMQGMNKSEGLKLTPPKTPASADKDDNGADGFTPPKE